MGLSLWSLCCSSISVDDTIASDGPDIRVWVFQSSGCRESLKIPHLSLARNQSVTPWSLIPEKLLSLLFSVELATGRCGSIPAFPLFPPAAVFFSVRQTRSFFRVFLTDSSFGWSFVRAGPDRIKHSSWIFSTATETKKNTWVLINNNE